MVYIVGNVPIMPIIAKFDGIYFIVAGNFFISLTTALSSHDYVYFLWILLKK